MRPRLSPLSAMTGHSLSAFVFSVASLRSLRLLRNNLCRWMDGRQTKAELLRLFDESQTGSLIVPLFDFGESSLVVFGLMRHHCVNNPGQLVCRRRDRFRSSTQVHLHAPIELAEVRLVPAERFRRHPQRPSQTILRSFGCAGLGLASSDGIVRAKAQPVGESPGRPEAAQIRPYLGQQNLHSPYTNARNCCQIHAHDAKEFLPHLFVAARPHLLPRRRRFAAATTPLQRLQLLAHLPVAFGDQLLVMPIALQ